jgi:hypothetical protein
MKKKIEKKIWCHLQKLKNDTVVFFTSLLDISGQKRRTVTRLNARLSHKTCPGDHDSHAPFKPSAARSSSNPLPD